MARKRVSVKPKKTMLIVTASEAESLYFSQLRKDSRYANLSVEWLETHKDSMEKNLAQVARLKTQGRYSEVWFVFSFKEMNINEDEFKDVQKIANRKRVNLAWSNPGISLWYYFHFFPLNATEISEQEINKKIREKISDFKPTAEYLRTDGIDFYKKICVLDNDANRNARMYNNIVEQFTGIAAINFVELSLAITENCGQANFTLNQRTIGMDK